MSKCCGPKRVSGTCFRRLLQRCERPGSQPGSRVDTNWADDLDQAINQIDDAVVAYQGL